MSKRLLPGPHADRFAGVDYSMSSTPNDTPQRATAAQMASRKIKELNRRRPKAPTPSAPQTPFSFGESNPSAATSSAPSNGFTFGQSQSFPGAGPSTTAQNGSQSVSFAAGGSSSFNFGGFTSSNNPFANVNGGAASSQPQSQSSNIFGTQSSVQPQATMSSQNSGPGLFGQTSAPPSTSGPIFQSQPASSGSTLFGQSNTAAAPASGSLFQSKPATASSNLFGQSTPASTSTPNLFGQSTSAPPVATSQSKSTTGPSVFGQSTTSAASAPSLFQTKPAATSSSIFGQNAPTSTGGSSNLFGQTSTSAIANGSQSGNSNGPTNMFGQSSATSISGPSVFQSKPATTDTPNLFGFGKPAVSKTESIPAFTPSTPEKASGSLGGKTFATSSAAPANTFTFGQSANTTAQKPIFGVTNDVDDMSTSPDGKFKTSEQVPTTPSIFGQKPVATETSKPAVSLFGSSTTAPATVANGPIANMGGSGNIFGQERNSGHATTNGDSAASSVFAPASAASTTTSHPFASLFSGTSKLATPATVTTNAPPSSLASAVSTSATTSTPFTSLFSSASKPTIATSDEPAVATTLKSSQSSSKPLFSGISTPAPPPLPVEQTHSKRLGGAIMDQTSTATSRVTSGLSSQETVEMTSRDRIRDLNRGFKEHISTFDPESQSLDCVILHYVRLRKMMGAPVGSLTNKPGKRKLNDTHSVESPDERSVAKKSKAQERSGAVLAEPEITSVSAKLSASGKRKSHEEPEEPEHRTANSEKRRAQPTLSSAAGASETSSIFASSFSAGSTASKQPFAASSSSNLFQPSASSAPSVTEAPRPASPVKKVDEPAAKPTFEIPKFGNLAGQDFTSQFGQGSFKASSKEAPKVNIELPKFSASGQNFMSQFMKKAQNDDTDDESDSEPEPSPKKPVEKVAAEASDIPALFPPSTTKTSSSIFDIKPGAPSPATAQTNNIFGHLSNSTATSDAADSSDDDITGTLKKRAKKAQRASEPEQGGSSLFGRITKPDGTPVHVSSDEDGAETPKPKFLFGQPTSTPSSLFPSAAASATPSLFSSSASKTSSIFGGPTQQPAATSSPFSAINPNPATHLFANQGGASGTASVTSDSNAEETDTEPYKDTQLNLMTNAGEEDEECLYEGRAKAMKFTEKPSEGGKVEKAWETQGLGQLRVLSDKEKKRARLLLRAEPSGRIILNTSIHSAIEYKVQPGSCQFLAPRSGGSDMWALRFKKEATEDFEKALKSAKDLLSA